VFSELLQKPKALALSVLFHAVIIGIVFINFNLTSKTILVKQADITKTVKAKVVDQQQLEQQKNKKKAIEEKRKKELEKKKREKEAKKRKQAEQKKRKQAEAKKRKAEADKKKKEEAKRAATAKKKAEQEKKEEAAKKRKLAAEKKQIELEKQKKLEAEKQKKLAEEKRLRDERLAKEAEEKRLLEEKKRQEAEKRRLAEEEQKRRQQELEANLKAEETQRRLNSAREKYILAIMKKVKQNWRRPQESGMMPECEVRVFQTKSGYILDVKFGKCSSGSQTYRQSIENAVRKAEPLPKPDYDSLFESEIKFRFNPG